MDFIVRVARSAAVALAAVLVFATPIPAAGEPGGDNSRDVVVPLDAPATPVVAGTSWRFIEILGVAPPATVGPTLEFSADGAATGSTGCNEFSGRYVSAGANLSFSGMTYTKMMCPPEAMAVERAVQTAVNRTSQAATAAGELDLLAQDATAVARLVPMTARPAGGM